MTLRRYAQLRTPWRAAVDTTTPHPAAFYAALVTQAFRYGLPAARTGGFLLAPLARNDAIPRRALARVLGAAPKRPRPDVDGVVEAVRSGWGELRTRLDLPDVPPPLSALALDRSAALTVFLFGDGPDPLCVAKLPPPGDPRVAAEAAALDEVEAARVGPRHAATLGNVFVQEALRGEPLRVQPLTPHTAASLGWSEEHDQLGAAFERLATVTARDEPPDELVDPIEAVLGDGRFEAQKRVVAALGNVTALRRSVYRHGDTSAHNCMFEGARFTGLVDWELAKARGAPGFDVWNAGLSFVEHGVGLVRWSRARVLETVTSIWFSSEFGRNLARAAERSCTAAGVPESVVPDLEVLFFARRLGRRIQRPDAYATGAETARLMLERVCAR